MNLWQTTWLLLLGPLLLLGGCEETNIFLATEAGVEAVKAVTLSDTEVAQIARQAAAQTDARSRVAPPTNSYARRLARLVDDHNSPLKKVASEAEARKAVVFQRADKQEQGITFNYKVYLDPTVNAFAMADGTIRIYSGLMDMMDDGELRFVIGHEMGHVLEKHIKKKLMLAHAGRAVRKGVAAQQGTVGDMARSSLGALAESLVQAQFSQQEERQADDYGLTFLQSNGYEPAKAISALEKLASLGSDHSFLSSHPAPEARAQRLAQRLAHPDEPEPGPDLDKQSNRLIDFLLGLWEKIQGLLLLVLEKVRQLLS
ncbi:MAG: peptidase M48 [Desulfobulbaceae bacterium]|nr:MAG: peptidase M48 [Desulfobulbaceae bacterium]